MTKVDFKKTLKVLYQASPEKVSVIDVPAMRFLAIDGTGDPGTTGEFQDAVQALYAVAYGLKFLFHKKEKPSGYHDYVVPPLEGLWWTAAGKPFDILKKDDWLWTLVIMTPGFFSETMVMQAREETARKNDLPAIGSIRLESLEEGRCAQILHIGPYAAEQPAIERLHEHIRRIGGAPRGKHHELYLSDPRRVPEDKWKTIIRQPFRAS